MDQTKLPGQDSNLDKENQNAIVVRRKPLPAIASGESSDGVAPGVAPILENPHLEIATQQHPPPQDLERVIAAWAELPEHVRAEIMAVVYGASIVGNPTP